MTDILLQAMLVMLILFAIGTLLRLLLGPPTASDRLVALNVLSAVSLALLVLWGGIRVGGRTLYLDVALVYDIFGFLGFLAITRFLKDRKEADDYSRNSGIDSLSCWNLLRYFWDGWAVSFPRPPLLPSPCWIPMRNHSGFLISNRVALACSLPRERGGKGLHYFGIFPHFSSHWVLNCRQVHMGE